MTKEELREMATGRMQAIKATQRPNAPASPRPSWMMRFRFRAATVIPA